MRTPQALAWLYKILLCCGAAAILFFAGKEFYLVAVNIGNLTTRWQIGLAAFGIVLLASFVLVLAAVWSPKFLTPYRNRICSMRARIGIWVYPLTFLTILWPVCIYQYSRWGPFFTSGWLRAFTYLLSASLAAVLLTRRPERIVSRAGFLGGLLLASVAFMLATAFVGVTSYPLSLSWSEGNRLWEYSLLFGRSIYQYPLDRPIPAAIDFGRQLLWGLPFLISGIDICSVRLWSALVSTIPYAVLGWAAFRRPVMKAWIVVFLGLWSFIFLKQAAIYTPLVVSAILVVLGYQRKWFIAFPLLGLAGCYAYLTRTTWALAPAMWAFTLVFVGDGAETDGKTRPWVKAALYGAAALCGAMLTFGWRVWEERMASGSAPAYFNWIPAVILVAAFVLAALVYLLRQPLAYLWQSNAIRFSVIGVAALLILGAGLAYAMRNLAAVSDQPLLWERLLPNTTYAQGILIALGLAVIPLLALLIWLAASQRWQVDRFESLIIGLPLLAFLAVGIIASVKSGGGSNLHNLDMFMVGLVLVASLAWQAYGYKIIASLDVQPLWVYLALILMIVLPAGESIKNIGPLDIRSGEKVYNVVTRIREEVKKADLVGEVLFIDQRQLLTFGMVKNISLVPEYEKKVLMDEAMAGDQTYFERFHADLARKRFALIICEPLKVTFTVDKESDYGFGQENDMWVKWVAEPILRYYEPIETYTKGRRVQLLVPKNPPVR